MSPDIKDFTSEVGSRHARLAVQFSNDESLFAVSLDSEDQNAKFVNIFITGLRNQLQKYENGDYPEFTAHGRRRSKREITDIAKSWGQSAHEIARQLEILEGRREGIVTIFVEEDEYVGISVRDMKEDEKHLWESLVSS